MRSIDLRSYTSIEVWANRTLFLAGRSGQMTVRLPSSSMSWAGRNSIALGSTSKTSVTITGPDAQVKAIWDELVRLGRAAAKGHRVVAG